jgi:predicted amidophosphoribosyltransferase
MLPLYIPALSCVVCSESVTRRSFPLCPVCADGLLDCPDLCSLCGSPACPTSSTCIRPWAQTPHIRSWAARFLLVGRGYEVLKKWKWARGPLFTRKVLRPTNELKNWLTNLQTDAIIPVPQHTARAWRLGGSPALEIAHWVASLAGGIPVLTALTPGNRTRRHQAELDAVGRFGNALEFKSSVELRARRVLLVDDFTTTGHTLRRAAASLMQDRHERTLEIHAFCLGLRPVGLRRKSSLRFDRQQNSELR